MNDEQILDLIRRALEHAVPDLARGGVMLSADTALADLGVESVGVMEAAGFIEDELGTEFPDDQLSRVKGVGDIARLIRLHATD